MKLGEFKRGLKTEYQKSFKVFTKHKPLMKIKFALVSVLILGAVLLAGEHFYCYLYNTSLKTEYANTYDVNVNSMRLLDSNEIYDKYLAKSRKLKLSILQKIFTVQRFVPDKGLSGGGNNINNDVRGSGIKDADIIQQSGDYLFKIDDAGLYVLTIDGVIISCLADAQGDLLHVYNNKVIVIRENGLDVYAFDGILTKINSFIFERYVDAYIVGNQLMIVGGSQFSQGFAFNAYYDGCSVIDYVYEIIKFNLDTEEIMKVYNLNSNYLTVYLSDEHLYLASSNYLRYGVFDEDDLTAVSIFDLNLQPTGSLRVFGSVLDHNAMHEYNGYFQKYKK